MKIFPIYKRLPEFRVVRVRPCFFIIQRAEVVFGVKWWRRVDYWFSEDTAVAKAHEMWVGLSPGPLDIVATFPQEAA